MTPTDEKLTTVDQRLLRRAHEKVREIVPEEKDKKDKYRTAVKGAPAFIQACGLAQAVSFWQAKAGGDEGTEKAEQFGYAKLLDHLDYVLDRKLREEVRNLDLSRYIFLTRRTQLALVFLKRMVDAYIPKSKENKP